MSTDLGSLLIKVFNSQTIRFQALSVIPVMLKRVSTSLSAFVVLASKIWAFVVYVFKKQTRAVRKIVEISSIATHILGCSKEFGQRLLSNIGLLLRKL